MGFAAKNDKELFELCNKYLENTNLEKIRYLGAQFIVTYMMIHKFFSYLKHIFSNIIFKTSLYLSENFSDDFCTF